MFEHGSQNQRIMDRRKFLQLSGASLVGAGLLGTLGTTEAPALESLAGESGDLVGEFEAAAREYGVSAEALMAMGYVNTRLRMPEREANVYKKGDLHGWGSYGIMALVQNPSSDTLGEASRLTGISESRLKSNRASNIRGGAALLAKAAGGSRSASSKESLGALASGNERTVAGVGAGGLYAEQVEAALDDGVPNQLKSGSDALFARPKLNASEATTASEATQSTRTASAQTAKPPHIWKPAAEGNYTPANRPKSHRIRYIIIHVTQGSWSSSINWFANPSSGVSAHYTIRSRDGKICQSVSDINIAYHAGNWPYNQHSIGIEHEGYISDPKWFTPEMFRSSAKLAAYLCHRYGIPPTRNRIIGHSEVPGADHTDPGRWWWWSYYMKRVKRFY